MKTVATSAQLHDFLGFVLHAYNTLSALCSKVARWKSEGSEVEVANGVRWTEEPDDALCC